MTALNRKLVRDLWQHKAQALAIALVMACGIATFVMSLSTLQSLQVTQATYYENYRFAHVFVSLKRAPESLRKRIMDSPGVAHVQTRIVVDVSLDVPGLAEPAVGRLISIPDYGESPLNRLYLRQGRMPSTGRGAEVVVSEGFANAHRLQPGSQLRAVINGRKQFLKIVGVALSPEYVYAIREGELIPDEKRFGVFWMPRTELAAAYRMEGAFNNATLSLTPDAREPDVISSIDRLLGPYGAIGAFGRADQVSNRYITNEISELRNMAVMAPGVFLVVAALLIHIVISRLVGTQREQIATLKAFGYSNFEVGWHYLKFVMVLALIGAVLGVAVGAYLGRELTGLYTEFFHFPSFDYKLGVGHVAFALMVSMGAATAGTLAPVRSAVILPPAEAMQPQAPASFRATPLDRIGLEQWLPTSARMVARQLQRRPVRTALTILGIALAAAVMVVGSFMADSVDYGIESQFHFVERQDMTVSFLEPSNRDAVLALNRLPGVGRTEPIRAVAARISNGHRFRRIGILGLPETGSLRRVVDVYRIVKQVPADGIVLSEKLAEVLDVRPGDSIFIEFLEGKRLQRRMGVHGVVDDFAGLSAMMSLDALDRAIGEPETVGGGSISADPAKTQSLYYELKNSPRVGSVSIKRGAYQSIKDTLERNLLRMRMFNVVFACIIAVGVVYNSARIALSERSRELATLRVIGFTRGEISTILLGELALLTLAAIPLGLVLGHVLAKFIVSTYDTELFRMPAMVYPRTYAFAAGVVIVAAAISGMIVRRRLDRLDLIGVLKTKE